MNDVLAFYAHGGVLMHGVLFWLVAATVAGFVRMITRKRVYGQFFLGCCAGAICVGILSVVDLLVELWAAIGSAPPDLAAQLMLQGHAIAFNGLALSAIGVAAITQPYFFLSIFFPVREPAAPHPGRL